MQRSYPTRYAGHSMEPYLDAIRASLGGEIYVEGEMTGGEAELVLVDDLSLESRGTNVTRGVRADVLYLDAERGAARLYGPICGERYGGPGAAFDLAPPLPLTVLLWRGGLSAGTWIVVTSREGAGYERALIRVTKDALERGQEIALDLEWCGAA